MPDPQKFRRRLLALSLGIGLILTLEALLAFLDIQPAPVKRPFSFTGKGPLIEPIPNQQGREVWRPSSSWFGGMRYYQEDISIVFKIPKPNGKMRIFCLGGSSTAGYPFGPRAAFGRRLGLMLDHLDPSLQHQVINLGVNGASSNQLRRRFPEVLAAEPDLIIIYSGHNDCMLAHRPTRLEFLTTTARRVNSFLKFSRIYLLVASAFAPDLTPTGDDPVHLHYPSMRKSGLLPEREEFFYPPSQRRRIGPRLDDNLKAMIEAARDRKVPVIVCTVAANLRDEPPEGSVHGRPLPPDERQRWADNFHRAERLYLSGNYGEALEYFSAAAAIDPDFAFLNYRMGQTLLMVERQEEAGRELARAVESADLPRRALGVVNEVVRGLEAEGVIVADVEAAFRAASPGGAPGYNLFLDGMHPNLAGHRLIAEVILRTMVRVGIARADSDQFAAAVAAADLTPDLSPDYLYDNYLFLATEQEYLGRIGRALRLSRMALRKKPGDEITRVMMIERMETKYGGFDTWE